MEPGVHASSGVPPGATWEGHREHFRRQCLRLQNETVRGSSPHLWGFGEAEASLSPSHAAPPPSSQKRPFPAWNVSFPLPSARESALLLGAHLVRAGPPDTHSPLGYNITDSQETCILVTGARDLGSIFRVHSAFHTCSMLTPPHPHARVPERARPRAMWRGHRGGRRPPAVCTQGSQSTWETGRQRTSLEYTGPTVKGSQTGKELISPGCGRGNPWPGFCRRNSSPVLWAGHVPLERGRARAGRGELVG